MKKVMKIYLFLEPLNALFIKMLCSDLFKICAKSFMLIMKYMACKLYHFLPIRVNCFRTCQALKVLSRLKSKVILAQFILASELDFPYKKPSINQMCIVA